MFVDTARVHITAGTGGSGCSSFRREKFVPRGGPDGGDGGNGGNVVVAADPRMRTLLDYKRNPHVRADRGQHGQGTNRTGRSGKEAQIRVPPGTVIYDDRTGEMMADLVDAGATAVVARGGRGGRGNARFVSSVNQAPREWEPGEEGEERILRFELKLIADVGLVGQPNAGKSTLLSRVSAARPKIADYPFTTLEPNLGIVSLGDYDSCVMADIPGLIEGASGGKGLGFEFLRHIERTRALLYLVDLTLDDPVAEYRVLRNELETYSASLPGRPSALLLTKLDLIAEADREVHLELRELPVEVLPGRRDGPLPLIESLPCTALSSQTGEGLDYLRSLITGLLVPEPADP